MLLHRTTADSLASFKPRRYCQSCLAGTVRLVADADCRSHRPPEAVELILYLIHLGIARIREAGDRDRHVHDALADAAGIVARLHVGAHRFTRSRRRPACRARSAGLIEPVHREDGATNEADKQSALITYERFILPIYQLLSRVIEPCRLSS